MTRAKQSAIQTQRRDRLPVARRWTGANNDGFMMELLCGVTRVNECDSDTEYTFLFSPHRKLSSSTTRDWMVG